MRPGRVRTVAALVAAVALGALAVWCLTRGIRFGSSTGGLLTAPIAQTELLGAWLLGAAAAGSAAVLFGVDAAVGLVSRRRG